MSARPVRVFIADGASLPISRVAAAHVLKTLLGIAGLPMREVATGEAADITYGRPPAPGRVQIVAAPEAAADFSQVQWRDDNGLVLLGFGAAPRGLELSGGQAVFHDDIVRLSYLLITGQHEAGTPRDRHDCHFADQLPLYRARLLHRPILDTYAGWLAATFANHQPLQRWPGGARFAACLTHDVDYPEIVRSVESVRLCLSRGWKQPFATIGALRDIWRGRNHMWLFPDVMEMEQRHGFRSAFYFCGRRGSLPGYIFARPDPFYDVGSERFRQLFRDLDAKGFEIGVHASYDAFRNAAMMTAEKQRVEMAAGRQVDGLRHHYWHLDQSAPWRTARLHANAGFVYDCSIGYERRAGFRYGVAAPFRLWDIEAERPAGLLQLPSTLMDDQAFSYRALCQFASPDEEVRVLLDQTATQGGLFVANFHPHGMNATFHPGWRDFYQRVLEQLAGGGGGWIATPREVAHHWLARERALDAIASAGA